MLDPIAQYGNYRLYDAAKFDTTYAREEIDHITANLVGLTQRGRDYITRLSHLPLIIASDTRDEAGAFFVNNSEYRAGHQSGVCYVSDYNKIRGTAHWIYGLVKIGYLNYDQSDDSLMQDIKKVLLHEDPNFALINQGDDTMALASSNERVEEWCKAVEQLKFAVWELDEGRKMIGKVIYQRSAGADLEIIPDAVTLVEKLLINERSVHSKHRPMSSAGNRERIRILKEECPAGPKIMKILDDLAIQHFGDKLDNLYRQIAYKDVDNTPELNPDLDLSQYNLATRTYILDQDTIHHKIKIEDVDKEIFKAFNSTIVAEDAAWILRTMKFMDESVHDYLVPAANDDNGRYVLSNNHELMKRAS
jgi:hypothetical protein